MNDVLAYALLLSRDADSPEAGERDAAALMDLFGDKERLNAAVSELAGDKDVREDKGNLVPKKITDKIGRTATHMVDPTKDEPSPDTPSPSRPDTDPVPVDHADATAKIAAIPGLSDADRSGLLGAVKSIYAGGRKAVLIAKAVASAVHEEAKLWATRLALAGVTYEEALPDAKELSNPLTGSTSATGGVDMVSQATGVPAASFIAAKLAAPIATFALAKVKSLLAGKRSEWIEMLFESGPPGPPPHPGLVWKEATHRWVNPHTGEEQPHVARMDSPAGGTPSAPHEPAAADPATVAKIIEWSGKRNVQKLPVPPEQLATYHADLGTVLSAMTTGARKAVEDVMSEYASALTFHPDVASVTAACSKASGKKESKVGGFVAFPPGGDYAGVNLDGANDSDDAQGIYAHELGHVIDVGHRFSGTKEWGVAYRTNILKNPDRHDLGRYARLSEAEGFAEFHRFLVKNGVEKTKTMYPKCVKLFEKWGLL